MYLKYIALPKIIHNLLQLPSQDYLSRYQKKKKKKKKKKEEEEEEEEILAAWWLSGSVLSRCFLAPLGVFIIMKTLEEEW